MKFFRSTVIAAIAIASLATPFVGAASAHAGTDLGGDATITNLPPTLKPGTTTSVSVRTLKWALIDLKLRAKGTTSDLGANPDFYDLMTKAQVVTFQKLAGASADGIVGPDTWSKIFYALERDRTAKYSMTFIGNGPKVAYAGYFYGKVIIQVPCVEKDTSLANSRTFDAWDSTQRNLADSARSEPCEGGYAVASFDPRTRVKGPHTFWLSIADFNTQTTHLGFVTVTF